MAWGRSLGRAARAAGRSGEGRGRKRREENQAEDKGKKGWRHRREGGEIETDGRGEEEEGVK